MNAFAEPALASRALGAVVVLALLVAPGWALDRVLGREDQPPWLAAWLHRVGLSVMWLSCGGLVLAQLGWFHRAPLVAWAALPVAAAAARRAATARVRPPAPRDLAVGVVVGAIAVAMLWPPFEDVLGGRDNGVYVAAGARLARHGAIRFEDPLLRELPADIRDRFFRPLAPGERGVASRFAGFYLEDRDAARVAPQFMPLYAVWIATLHDWLGLRGALAVSFGFGVLALAWIHRTAEELASFRAGLFAVIGMGLCVLEVWFGRSHLSEVPGQALGFAALASALAWERGGGRAYALGAAGGLGLTLVTRIDSLLMAAPLAAALLVAAVVKPGRPGERTLLVTSLVALAFVAIAWTTTARGYVVEVFFKNLPDRPMEWALSPSMLAGLALTAGATALAARRTLGPPLARALAWVAGRGPWLAVGLLVVAFYAWFLRPHVIRGTQGLAMVKLADYLGPGLLAAGVLGGAALLADPARPARALFLAAALPMTALYVQHSRNRIDQFWEMRRFISLPVPALVIAAAVLLDGLARRTLRIRARLVPVGLVVALGLVAAGAVQLWSASRFLRPHVEDRGALAALEHACAAVPEDVVLVADSRYESPTAYLDAPLAYLCGRDVLELPPGDAASATIDRTVAALLGERGRAVWLATVGNAPLFSDAFHPVYVRSVGYRGPRVVPTLWWPPDTIEERAFSVDLFRVEPGPPEPRGALDMDPEESAWLDGFYAAETQPETSVRYRWTRARARAFLPGLDTSRPATLYLRLASQRMRGDAAIRMEVGLESGARSSVDVAHGFRVFEVPLAASPGRPVLVLEADRRSQRFISSDADRRDLGVSVDWVAWDVPASLDLADARVERLVAGFFPPERDAESGRGFRWTGEKASVYLPRCPTGPVEVSFALRADRGPRDDGPDTQPYPIRFRIRGETIGPFSVPPGWQKMRLRIPAGLREPGDASVPRVDLLTPARRQRLARDRRVGARVSAVESAALAAPLGSSEITVSFEPLP